MEADFVYVTRARFSRMEIGELLPNAAEVVALCSALDVSLSWLLLGREDASGQDR
jgi:transcriptional regulator with XRE-family HTH domain